MNTLLLLAGGIGRRAETAIPKQFIEVKGKPVIIHTLNKFQDFKRIDQICIVVHTDWIDKVADYCRAFNITKVTKIVSGGRTGLESVKRGIGALTELDGRDLILIHDSVRPFISEQAIDDNINMANKYGVAVTSVPCVETLVEINKQGKSIRQIPRDSLMRVMTPQTFRIELLRALFEKVDISHSEYPSTFALYMSQGNPVYCSSGSERNIKITYPEDIEYLKNLFNE